jgi:hypothetical protein
MELNGKRRKNMFIIKKVKIRSHEKGLHFRDREFKGLLDTGRHWLADPLCQMRVDVVSQRDPWLVHKDLDLIVKSGLPEEEAMVLDLKDHERALVWIDGRFERVLGPGVVRPVDRIQESALRSNRCAFNPLRTPRNERHPVIAGGGQAPGNIRS